MLDAGPSSLKQRLGNAKCEVNNDNYVTAVTMSAWK